MTRIIIVIFIYHRHKLTDLIQLLVAKNTFTLLFMRYVIYGPVISLKESSMLPQLLDL
jgi:hypothetical protein